MTGPRHPPGEEEGGRIFYTDADRSRASADAVELLSVGVDIGSSTTHLAFSRIMMVREGERFVAAARDIVHESDVTLTPHRADDTIDVDALGAFLAREYSRADIDPDRIDTGAVILTGIAARRRNARRIGELFADETGRFVALSAGDALEAILAAHGSGAASRSAELGRTVMNIDIGGGTTKIALAAEGEVVDQTALDLGARLVLLSEDGSMAHIEPAGRAWAERAGIRLELGARPEPKALARLVEAMAEAALLAAAGGDPGLLRLPPLRSTAPPSVLIFSGGVAEYVYGREARSFGDLGPLLGAAIRRRFLEWGPPLEFGTNALRATVVGASQYTVQVSGNTIFAAPERVLPLRNLAVIPLAFELDVVDLDAGVIADAVRSALARHRPHAGERHEGAALAYRWRGSATLRRLDALCRGVIDGLDAILRAGHPLVLVGDGDVGGLVGAHCRELLGQASPVVSIDGIVATAFDFLDIGALLGASGAVPVVVKSLVFPTPQASARQAPVATEA